MTDFYKQQSVSTTGAPGTLCEQVRERNRPVRKSRNSTKKDKGTAGLRMYYCWSENEATVGTFNDPGAEFMLPVKLAAARTLCLFIRHIRKTEQ